MKSFLLLFALLGVLIATSANCQDIAPTKITDQNATGNIPFSGSIGTEIEHVDLATGNLIVNIPIIHVPGRGGLDFDFAVRYDARFLVPNIGTTSSGWAVEARPNLVPTGVGWTKNQPYVTFVTGTRSCLDGSNDRLSWIGNYVYTDAEGSKHTFLNQRENGECVNGSVDVTVGQSPEQEGNGHFASGVFSAGAFTGELGPVIGKNGVSDFTGGGAAYLNQEGPNHFTFLQLYGTFTDTNGNILQNYPGGKDTLGKIPVTETVSSNQIVYTVKDSNGQARTYTLNFGLLQLATHFNVRDLSNRVISEINTPRKVLTSLVLPSGRSYTFQYDSYGGITSIALPTGAVVTYQWSTYSAGQFSYRYVSSRTVTGAGPSATWSFQNGGSGLSRMMTVTDPLGQVSTYTFTSNRAATDAKFYSASNALLREVQLKYLDGDIVDQFSFPTQIKVSQDGLTQQKTLTYGVTLFHFQTCDGFEDFCSAMPGSTMPSSYSTTDGNALTTQETDWGTSPNPGPVIRNSSRSYLHQTDSRYLSRNILDLVTDVQILDATGALAARTLYEYDNYAGATALIASGGGVAQHDDLNFGSSFLIRGNETAIKKWRNSDGALLATQYQYDDVGNTRTTIDPLLHSYSWTYADRWNDTACPIANSQAYPTERTDPSGLRSRRSYYTCSGLAATDQDENNIRAGQNGISFLYDMFGRTTQKNFVDGGLTTNTYNDIPPVSVSSTTKITASVNISTSRIMDGLGRTTQTQLTSDPEGVVKTDSTYDGLGRLSTVSNPYRSTSEATYGVTSYQYDALDRTTRVIPPDGTALANNVSTTYSGNSVIVTDQAGFQRRTFTDALGRLTQVDEPGPTSLTNPWTTKYLYDVLGNLTCVEQHGSVATATGCSTTDFYGGPWRVRRFYYNSLSQLTLAKNPESNAISYTYDNDGNVSAKTDANGSVTTFTYVSDRITGKSYTPGPGVAATSPVTYSYDSTAGGNAGLGRRTGMADGSGSTSWFYDTKGRVTQITRTINSIPENILYGYNYDDSIAGVTYPGGRQITYLPGGAGRPLNVHDVGLNINYVSGTCASGACYTASGAISSATLGSTITISNTYNSRLQPLTASATSGANTLMSRTYDLRFQSSDNGNVWGITDNLDSLNLPNRPVGSATFNYDSVNRITGFATTGSDCTSIPGAISGTKNTGNSYTIDAWGNLTNKAVSKCTAESLNESAGNDNRFTGSGRYDSAGNMVSNGLYTFNAENQVSSANGELYKYDGEGNRVSKTGTVSELHWNGASSDPLAESDAAGNMTADYIYFGSARVARVDANNPTHPVYYLSDQLGSTTVLSSDAGVNLGEEMYLPFGGERWSSISDSNHYKFTGKQRDAETGLDYFGARYYSSNMGRWLSPDWSQATDPVPYADLGDPQSLNLYGYVRNNPVFRVDLDGHGCPPICVPSYENMERSIGFLKGLANTAKGTVYTAAQISNAISNKVFGDSYTVPEPEYWPIDNELQQQGADLVPGTVAAAPEIVGASEAALSGISRAESEVPAVEGAATTSVREGIYEGPDANAPGRTYVGQSGNIPARLADHEASGKFPAGTKITTTEVRGGKTAREVAEHNRIQDLGGVRSKPGSRTSNQRNPIGSKRAHLLNKKKD